MKHSELNPTPIRVRSAEMAASAPDLTRSKEEADRLFSLLSAGTVTPCALADVLEELL